MQRSPARRITQLALFTTIALILFLVESCLPPLTSVPGVKVGLPNMVTLAVLYLYSRRDALLVLAARVLLASLFAGQMMTLLYSLSGGLLCFAVCALLCPIFPVKRMWLLSMTGAVFHNIGQILAAIFVTGTPEIVWYLPVLLVSGLVSGCITGLVAQYLLLHWNKLKLPKGAWRQSKR